MRSNFYAILKNSMSPRKALAVSCDAHKKWDAMTTFCVKCGKEIGPVSRPDADFVMLAETSEDTGCFLCGSNPEGLHEVSHEEFLKKM